MRPTPVLLVLLIACGDNYDPKVTPDGRPHGDVAIDALGVIPCAYTEMMDATNDGFFGTGMAETTNLTFGSPTAICGKIDTGHYDNPNMLVDVDQYKITVPTSTNILLSVTAPGADVLNTVLLEIYNPTGSEDGVGKMMGDLAITSTPLSPGDYIINVSGFHGTAATAAIDYKVVLLTDDPQTRCPKSTAAAVYTESLDGTSASGNDVYEVRYGTSPRRRFTNAAADMVEPTGIMAMPGMTYRVSGVNSKPTMTPASWADAYQDRDTYQITMGANTDQLSLRLNWPGTTMDFDYLVFPMGQLNDFADAYLAGNMEDEFQTFSVIPGMSYWVFVGADDASTGQPVAYDLTVCGSSFTRH